MLAHHILAALASAIFASGFDVSTVYASGVKPTPQPPAPTFAVVTLTAVAMDDKINQYPMVAFTDTGCVGNYTKAQYIGTSQVFLDDDWDQEKIGGFKVEDVNSVWLPSGSDWYFSNNWKNDYCLSGHTNMLDIAYDDVGGSCFNVRVHALPEDAVDPFDTMVIFAFGQNVCAWVKPNAALGPMPTKGQVTTTIIKPPFYTATTLVPLT